MDDGAGLLCENDTVHETSLWSTSCEDKGKIGGWFVDNLSLGKIKSLLPYVGLTHTDSLF